MINRCTANSWFLDTQCLVLLRDQFKIKEIPVEWEEHRTRKTSIKRLYSDVKLHGTGLIKLIPQKASEKPLFFLKSDVAQKFIKFCIIGILGFLFVTGVTYITSILTRDMILWYVANTIAFFIAIVIQFLLNKKWTFANKSKRVKKQLGLDVFGRIIGWGINEVILIYLSSMLSLNILLATIAGVACSVIFNFIFDKFIVFTKRD